MSIRFEDILNQLEDGEKSDVALNKIDSPEKLIPILLKRVNPRNVQLLATIVKQSLLPSICEKTNEEIDQLFAKIDLNPNLLFDKNIQRKIEEFTAKRFERDKQVVIERASDISKLVLLMEEYLNEAISSNGSGSKNVLNIREKIQAARELLDDWANARAKFVKVFPNEYKRALGEINAKKVAAALASQAKSAASKEAV